MNYLLGSFFSPVLYLPGTVLRLLPFRKLLDKKQKLLLGVFSCILLVLHMGIWYLWGKYNGKLDTAFLKADMILFPFVMMLINHFIIKGRLKEHLFTYGIVMLFEYMNMTSSLLFSNILSRFYTTTRPFFIYTVFYVVLQIVFIPITMKLLNMTVAPFLNHEKSEYWNTIWFVPIAMVLVCYFTVFGEETIDSLPPVIGRLFLMISAIIICINLSRDYLRMAQQLETKRQLSMQKEYYAELSEQVEKARRTRHDMKHHIAALQHFIDTDDKLGLQSYCFEYTAVLTGERIPYTGNSAADGVLYHYSEKAKDKNIDFEIKGAIKAKNIGDTDLCVLLGNALDNAITACERAENKFISLVSESDDFMLSIIIVNSFDGTIDIAEEKIMSRKVKGRQGVGLDSMRKTIEKYGGTMDISYDESTFKVIFLIPQTN